MSYKIISGGQWGPDYVALLVGKKYSFPTGGTAPKGYKVIHPSTGKVDYNPNLANFGLVESPSPNFRDRTISNIRNSHATALFGDVTSNGSKLAIKTCKKLSKPLLINYNEEELLDFILKNKITVLNVAGNRVRNNNYDLCVSTYKTLEKTLIKLI